jgi:hypothetical protein
MSLKLLSNRYATSLVLLALILPLACNKKPETSTAGQTFATPDDAGNALLAAAKSGDQNAILALFGPDAKDVIYSGDPVEDKNAAAAFVTRYDRMHRWRKMPNGSQILIVGVDNFPFAVPLAQNAGGQWSFDTAAGKEEVLSRRVGRNELAVIDVCSAIATAQAEYYAHPHDGQPAKQYAAKFLSDPGRQNGLYWEAAKGQPQSPLGPLAAFATDEGYTVKPNAHVPFHGYYFRMLRGQTDKAPGGARHYNVAGKRTGGFAIVAYPAAYGNSGVMTFIVNQDGVLLEKDLGKDTEKIAAAMIDFDPDPAWKIVTP